MVDLLVNNERLDPAVMRGLSARYRDMLLQLFAFIVNFEVIFAITIARIFES